MVFDFVADIYVDFPKSFTKFQNNVNDFFARIRISCLVCNVGTSVVSVV